MAINLTEETVVPFSEAARRLPPLRAGRRVSPSTIWRWSAAGVLSRSGKRIRLETIRVGGSSCTSLEALQRFFSKLSDDEPSGGVPAAPMGKAHQQAEGALDAAGI